MPAAGDVRVLFGHLVAALLGRRRSCRVHHAVVDRARPLRIGHRLVAAEPVGVNTHGAAQVVRVPRQGREWFATASQVANGQVLHVNQVVVPAVHAELMGDVLGVEVGDGSDDVRTVAEQVAEQRGEVETAPHRRLPVAGIEVGAEPIRESVGGCQASTFCIGDVEVVAVFGPVGFAADRGNLPDGVIDAEAKGGIVFRLAKMENISPDSIVAVGDGANDCLMIKNAGLGVAFNAKEVLKRVSDGSLSRENLLGLLNVLGLAEKEKDS